MFCVIVYNLGLSLGKVYVPEMGDLHKLYLPNFSTMFGFIRGSVRYVLHGKVSYVVIMCIHTLCDSLVMLYDLMCLYKVYA